MPRVDFTRLRNAILTTANASSIVAQAQLAGSATLAKLIAAELERIEERIAAWTKGGDVDDELRTFVSRVAESMEVCECLEREPPAALLSLALEELHAIWTEPAPAAPPLRAPPSTSVVFNRDGAVPTRGGETWIAVPDASVGVVDAIVARYAPSTKQRDGNVTLLLFPTAVAMDIATQWRVEMVEHA
jgi:hypothetical protein